MALVGSIAAMSCPIPNINGKFSPTTLQNHFDSHGAALGAKTPEEYQSMAAEFLQKPHADSGLEQFIRPSSGDITRFDPQTGAFGVIGKDGIIRTYFIPTPEMNGGMTPYQYWLDQIRRWS
ncbi:pyocin large subunit-like protein [Psychromicrobium silvestre]|uniref:Pyocin large subunit-like protein n=1 Tax=Psychromicrobium silvestre TaxID=1645614 RepID=A0A7Y9LVK3_9MICC|nr:hypothetical protein [Psychromicrobium silvestre]NYE96389.1 pyocin large subunit-like protein [Psychromicrobium silvestre]